MIIPFIIFILFLLSISLILLTLGVSDAIITSLAFLSLFIAATKFLSRSRR